MHYLIEHETVLSYPEPIREHQIELRLVPRGDGFQQMLSCQIETEPTAEMRRYTDYFGNRVDYFCVIAPHDRLVTRLSAEVTTTRHNPFDFIPLSASEQQEWLREALRMSPALYDYLLHRSAVTPDTAKLADVLAEPLPRFERNRPVMDGLVEMMAWISTVLEYRTGATAVHQELVAALRQGAGVCQDFAHMFIAVARSWGVPARYVMGYLDPGIGSSGAPLATHAWAEALIPGGGWIGFDATHNLLANDRYVAVAVGRDSYDAAPQRGSFKGENAGGLPSVRVTMREQ